MRQSWTDDRLDDLNGKVDALRLEMRTDFKAVRGETKEEFAAVRGEMRESFDKIDKRFERLDERFDKSDERFAKGLERIEERLDSRLTRIYQTMIWFCGIVLAALISVIAG